ncbi:MAG: SDR family NAD(P)-dependent oxidoreductase [Chitinophagaceae bacterium]|nr:SDR family NAD(P)-dependent oxidoreductase [Chitinophagaceae bacterium]
MAKIFITGSSDGLGLLTALSLREKGHEVILHARNEKRKKDVEDKLPGAYVAVADLSDPEAVKSLASELNSYGGFDAVVHNAGVYNATTREILHVNVLAPYILTALMSRPQRLIYLSSDMHRQGHAGRNFDQAALTSLNYADSKLYVVMLALYVSRHWQPICANAVNPGWVPTKMGGSMAPDDLKAGYETQVWLAEGADPNANVSGCYFYHKTQRDYNWEAGDLVAQEKFIRYCSELTGVIMP